MVGLSWRGDACDRHAAGDAMRERERRRLALTSREEKGDKVAVRQMEEMCVHESSGRDSAAPCLPERNLSEGVAGLHGIRDAILVWHGLGTMRS